MNIWIVTTGSSDVKLKTDENWANLFRKVRSQLYDRRFAPTQPPNTDTDEPFIVPARAMGMVYGSQLTDEYYEDLHFPLLDAFSAKLLEKGKTHPDRIIVILTNQEVVFDNEDERKLDKSPYWQDTCTLKPIFEQYFKLKFPKVKNEKIDYLELKPQSQIEGLDNWDQALVLVQKAFSTLDFDKNATVYVSHQAGTPAISSAVQFVSLARFGKQVEFLVSNEYNPSLTKVIDGSQYLKGIQVQQAKGLIESGSPGAALKLLESEQVEGRIDTQVIDNISQVVDFFNLNRSLESGGDEFSIEAATQRIVDAIELIRIFFKQSNYLLGIALLAAAQETFLKVAVLSKIAKINATSTVNGSPQEVKNCVVWYSSGLFLSNAVNDQSIPVKKEILRKLKFPTELLDKIVNDKDFQVTNRNYGLLAWLQNLEPNFKPWPLLKWSCGYRNSDDDLRNQLMHNLRGMEAAEVCEYLSENVKPSSSSDVVKTYDSLVKDPLMWELKRLGLKFDREKIDQKLQSLAASLRLN
ncbi:hypothetical protein [Limnofasciculus baicalensis]|uniref:CRISPR-associated protein n=1 Tax=Limnofasciculus baicalensis BBK-W-15 TaxID=2699891 RepID=A0AAE3GS75_9CYAN|nr:hypothetical protein [Limnofasciculus baicalensis]MCP2729770.1 hypothetical protein [Limnofasciculus baicalensis BBK-W-15]